MGVARPPTTNHRYTGLHHSYRYAAFKEGGAENNDKPERTLGMPTPLSNKGGESPNQRLDLSEKHEAFLRDRQGARERYLHVTAFQDCTIDSPGTVAEALNTVVKAEKTPL